jgi:hypothetical protein
VTAEFWTLRPVLANIHAYARAEYVSPWAMLGSVLAYVTALTPPRVQLPKSGRGQGHDPRQGGGSLNLFVGLVGKPGAGKDAARDAAREWVGTPGDDAHLYQREIGTGQGLVAAYVKRQADKDTKEHVTLQLRESALITVSEIDQITAHAKQQASTLVPTLRSAWMGQLLGGLYKDVSKDLSVPSHTYRMCLVVGIQPAHARNLVGDAGGGLPQRFIWMPATDPTMPEDEGDDDPEYPELWEWKPPVRCREMADPFELNAIEDGHEPNIVMEVCSRAMREIRAERRARVRGEDTGDDMSTHDTFARLKVAGALALLDGRTEVTEEDWDLSAIVMLVSCHVRDRVMRSLEAEDKRKRELERRQTVDTAVEVERAKTSTALERVKARICNRLSQTPGEWTSSGKLRKALTSSARALFEDAAEELTGAGHLERKEENNIVAYRLPSNGT